MGDEKGILHNEMAALDRKGNGPPGRQVRTAAGTASPCSVRKACVHSRLRHRMNFGRYVILERGAIR